jgi:inorganic pyrophosphatase
MSKTTTAGIVIGIPFMAFTVMFAIGKMSETAYGTSVGALSGFGLMWLSYLAKDDDKIDYAAEIDELKKQIEEMERLIKELEEQIEEFKRQYLSK